MDFPLPAPIPGICLTSLSPYLLSPKKEGAPNSGPLPAMSVTLSLSAST